MSDHSIKPAVLVNLSAKGGRSRKIWEQISSKVLEGLPSNSKVITYEIPFDIRKCLDILIAKEEVNCFISAGGDGSINWIINNLVKLKGEHLQDYFLGGIGLGSSNDFLKPVDKTIEGIPVRVNLRDSQLADMVKVSFLDGDGHKQTRYFLINASVGVTATANLLFNKEDPIIHYLKPRSTDLAILYTAVKSIITFKNLGAKLVFDKTECDIILSNLAILKNPHVSGNFRYDQIINLDDGQMGLNLCLDMHKFHLIKTLFDLSKGKFSGKRNRISVYCKKLSLELSHAAALEMDGEVALANNMKFVLVPLSINLLR